MRKTYQMFLALALIMLGATNAMGQKIYRAELDPSMFKAWDSNLPGANEVANPDPEPKSNNPFTQVNDIYKTVNAYGTIYGHSNVYYLWYADLTGTKKMTVTATPGMRIRLMLNREPYTEGGAGDADGGNYVEIIKEVEENGQVVFDFTTDDRLAEYIHLNAIKVPNGSPSGVVTSIMIEGTVKPVTGILSMINNGDAEGDDLGSFPVSWDGPNNGNTANDLPEIVEGVGKDGSKAFKVTTYPNPTETWHTQFYVKSDEMLPKGTKWALKMSIKADKDTKITTSAQATPRVWRGGMGIDEFPVTTDWQDYTWSGEIGIDDFQSIAFDLNQGSERNADDSGWLPGNGGGVFYFDNIEFGIDLGGTNPMSQIKTLYGFDVICVNLANNTNMKALVDASTVEMDVEGKLIKTLIFPNDCATVTWNDVQCNILSIEGRPDGNLYIFLQDMDGQGGESFEAEDAIVKVEFKNPEAKALHLTFNEGKWAGQAVPDFSGIICKYQYDLGDNASYLWGPPTLEKAEPEKESFNLPADTKDFIITFSQKIDATTVVAKLGKENLTVTNVSDDKKTVTLTRTGTDPLDGVVTLVISKATGEKGGELETAIQIKYSFGITNLEGDDQPQVIYEDDFAASDNPGDGWIVTADGGGMQPANSTAGSRLQHNQEAFAADLLYLCARGNAYSAVALYGTVEGKKLELQGGKNYKLTLNASQWDRDDARTLLVQVLPEAAVNAGDGSIVDDSQILASDRKDITDKKDTKKATSFEITVPVKEDGNYVIRMVPGNAQGNAGGYGDGCAIGNIKLAYMPDVMGLEKMQKLATSLDEAKATLAANDDERHKEKHYDTLDQLVKEYDGKIMTAPSAYDTATQLVDTATVWMKNYRSLCDDYDKLPGQAYDIYAAKKDSKFKGTDFFAQITAMVNKYCTITTENVPGEDGVEVPTEVMSGYKVIMDSLEMAGAKVELNNAIDMANQWFTEGPSAVGDWSATRTGYAVLVERVRLGAETLKQLGVPSTDALIEEANTILEDNDALAEGMKNRIKLELYNKLKDPANEVFKPVVDEVTEEETVPTLDMGVFVKNPCLYKISDGNGHKDGAVPGWDVVDGRGFSTGWNTYGSAKVPVDAMFSNWGGSFTVSQTIEDLPAGVYTMKAAYGERKSESESADALDGSYFFAVNSANDTITVPCVRIGQSFPALNLEIPDFVVADGKATIGVQAGQNSSVFFDKVQILMTSAATAFNYVAAYDAVLAGIDVTVAKPAQVRRIELFDLNGRRIGNARKGVAIMRKHMDDGTIRTEKVMVK